MTMGRRDFSHRGGYHAHSGNLAGEFAGNSLGHETAIGNAGDEHARSINLIVADYFADQFGEKFDVLNSVFIGRRSASAVSPTAAPSMKSEHKRNGLLSFVGGGSMHFIRALVAVDVDGALRISKRAPDKRRR